MSKYTKGEAGVLVLTYLGCMLLSTGDVILLDKAPEVQLWVVRGYFRRCCMHADLCAVMTCRKVWSSLRQILLHLLAAIYALAQQLRVPSLQVP